MTVLGFFHGSLWPWAVDVSLTPEKKRQWLWFASLSLGGIVATWLLVRLARLLVRI